jgi:uncharacterized phage protein (TIGR01671 family)
MKRPIKFRFWCNAGKSFIQQYRYSGYVDELFDEKEWDILTPSQYTGCNDCEEKEIWEGDIVEFNRTIAGSEIKKETGEIQFFDGAYIVKLINPIGTVSLLWLHDVIYSDQYKLKVVGNKWENPS